MTEFKTGGWSAINALLRPHRVEVAGLSLASVTSLRPIPPSLWLLATPTTQSQVLSCPYGPRSGLVASSSACGSLQP